MDIKRLFPIGYHMIVTRRNQEIESVKMERFTGANAELAQFIHSVQLANEVPNVADPLRAPLNLGSNRENKTKASEQEGLDQKKASRIWSSRHAVHLSPSHVTVCFVQAVIEALLKSSENAGLPTHVRRIVDA